MSRNRLRRFGIGQTMLPDHIWRIGRYNVKRSSRKKLICFFDISLYDRNPILQMVHGNAAPRHIRTVCLNLQTAQGLRLRLCGQQQRNNPRPGSQIQYTHTLPDACRSETRKEHRVHSEAKSPRVLNDFQPVSLQIVNPFA